MNSSNQDQENVRLSAEQEQALALMLSGWNVFLTGEAGTGKSAVIHEFKRRCPKRLVCLAPTGIAALNIGGETIHRFFKFPACFVSTIPDQLDERHWAKLNAVEVILIDEISMARSDVFAAIDEALRRAAPLGLQNIPFGGKQMIVVGDFFQLGPIARDAERLGLQLRHSGFYAFNTQAWANAHFENVILRQVHRQQDRKFLEILNAVRTGDLIYEHGDDILDKSYGNYLHDLNQECFSSRNPIDPEVVSLCATREMADYINGQEMSRLPDKPVLFSAVVRDDFPEEMFPVKYAMEVKIDERVMLVANNVTEGYVNGDIGTVVEIPPSRGEVIVALDRGEEVTVKKFCWEHYDYIVEKDASGAPTITPFVVGQYTQIPLIPAYAITIHKSQGQTLDAVRLVLMGGCFAPGQLYVALSRCRDSSKLSFDRPLELWDCIVDPAVLVFYQGIDPQRRYAYHSLPLY